MIGTAATATERMFESEIQHAEICFAILYIYIYIYIIIIIIYLVYYILLVDIYYNIHNGL